MKTALKLVNFRLRLLLDCAPQQHIHFLGPVYTSGKGRGPLNVVIGGEKVPSPTSVYSGPRKGTVMA
jgi:hypothetical protein